VIAGVLNAEDPIMRIARASGIALLVVLAFPVARAGAQADGDEEAAEVEVSKAAQPLRDLTLKGNAQRDRADFEGARRTWGQCVAAFRRDKSLGSDSPAVDAAAEAQFRLGELEVSAFDSVKLEGEHKALEQALKTKQEKAKKVHGLFGDVCSLSSSEWCLAAEYQQGLLYERFATVLKDLPCPSDLQDRIDQDGCATFASSVSEKAQEMSTRAKGAYRAALTRCDVWAKSSWCARTKEGLQRADVSSKGQLHAADRP